MPSRFQLSRDLAKKIEQELTYPGTDQSHGDSREPVCGVCEIGRGNEDMKVLFIGDIMGEPGRRAVARRCFPSSWPSGKSIS